MIAISPPISCGRLRRFSSGNSRNIEAKAQGIMPPPRKPWMLRKTIIEVRSQASAQSRLATVKPAAAMQK